MKHLNRPSSVRAQRRAFSLAESAISVILVGGLLVVSLNTLGAAKVGSQRTGNRGKGQLLAQDLMSEILSAAYSEPVDVPAFGPEASETVGSRAVFDDVDDYHNWTASPPQEKDGSVIADLDGWERRVTVQYVYPTGLTQATGADMGTKLITVDVTHNNVDVASIVAVAADEQIDYLTTPP